MNMLTAHPIRSNDAIIEVWLENMFQAIEDMSLLLEDYPYVAIVSSPLV
jgi:hypothetical protein